MKTQSTVNTDKREIVVIRIFDAPRELVWDAMTDPKKVVNWWGPNGFTTTIDEMDLRPGGAWRLTMHGPDGTDYPNKSVFIEVTKPERIVFSHAGGKKGARGAHFEAFWTFEEVEGGKTKLTLRQVFPTAEDLDTVVNVYGAVEGGKQCFERLGEQLAKTPFTIERTFDAPVAIVWKAIADCDQMKEWYFTGVESFKPVVGFETQVNVHHNNQDFLHLWKVTEVVPERKLAYSWKYKAHPGDSLVTFELFPEGTKTRVKLTHSGLETFQPEIHPNYARGNFAQGWTALIGTCLREFLEKQQAAST